MPVAGAKRGPQTLNKEREGFLQRFPNAPCQRNADQKPERNCLGIQSAFADAERTGFDCRRLLMKFGALFGEISFRHIPFRINRPDQQIGCETDDQQPRQNIEDRSVDLISGDARRLPGIVQIIDDDRADDARRRPRGQ